MPITWMNVCFHRSHCQNNWERRSHSVSAGNDPWWQEKYVDLGTRYIFEPIAVESTRDLRRIQHISLHATSLILMILEGGSHSTLARLESPATCTRGSRYWCSASMLSYYTTVCQPLTAWIDDRTHYSAFSIQFFKLHRDYIYRGYNNAGTSQWHVHWLIPMSLEQPRRQGLRQFS